MRNTEHTWAAIDALLWNHSDVTKTMSFSVGNCLG
jgi:hypothetical protein